MSTWNKTKQFFGFEEPEGDQPLSEPVKVVRSGPAPSTLKQTAISEIKFEEPRVYEDSLNIASDLRDNKPVIISLKHLDAKTGKRLIDFICGTAYAINGHMMKIADNIFLFTPANVKIIETEEKSTFEQGIEEEQKQVFFRSSSIPE